MTQRGLARSDGAEVHCSISGTGVPILAFNGATLPMQFWDPVVARTEHHLQWLRLDARNTGGTRSMGSFTLDDIAADGAALLDDQGISRAVVIGHAWGGRVAQVFARDFGTRVRGMVICGTGGQFPPTAPTDLLTDLRRARRDGQRSRWEDLLERAYCGPSFRRERPNEFAELADMIWSTPVRTAARWDPDTSPSPSYWGLARLPALLLYGTADHFGTPENAQDLAQRLPDARLRVLEDAGHFLIRERADEVALELLAFAQQIAEADMVS